MVLHKPETFAQVLLDDEAENEQPGEPNNTDTTPAQWIAVFMVALLASVVMVGLGWLSPWKVCFNLVCLGIVLFYFAARDPK